jgi:radical SAM protein with 4Fe4S-binding SPASM domain
MTSDAPRMTFAGAAPSPRYVVWELTLRCDLACHHCGSRAGKPRAGEITRDEALGIVAELAAMGTREVALIGGEAYLAPHFLEVVAAIAEAGIRCSMTTGGRGLDGPLARAAKGAGMAAVSVSVDGLAATHDRLRGVAGSHRAAVAAIGHVRDAGMEAFANTQWNRLNLPEVEPVADLLIDAGILAWQVQITGPMGRAADWPDVLLQPYELLSLVPRLATVAERARARGCRVEAANNLGYFGPHEHALRAAHWQGCSAGIHVLGIEADGSVKGCPSLPSAPYVGGNLRANGIRPIWEDAPELRFARDRGAEGVASELWGYCARCYYAAECRAGCSWTAHTLLGRRGNMPYCHHRATELQREGKRERLVQRETAPGLPFDFGRFDLIEEPWEAPGQGLPASDPGAGVLALSGAGALPLGAGGSGMGPPRGGP